MKRKYFMLSMMISGPKQTRNDIDVYQKSFVETEIATGRRTKNKI